MNLLPIEANKDPNSSSAKCRIICCDCQDQKTWNQAAQMEWTWDQQGKPYESYRCKACSKKSLTNPKPNGTLVP